MTPPQLTTIELQDASSLNILSVTSFNKKLSPYLDTVNDNNTNRATKDWESQSLEISLNELN